MTGKVPQKLLASVLNSRSILISLFWPRIIVNFEIINFVLFKMIETINKLNLLWKSKFYPNMVN